MYIIDYNIDFNDVSLNKKMCKLKNNSIISVLLLKDAFYKYLIETHNKIRNTSKGLSYEKCMELISQNKGIHVLVYPKSLHVSENEF